MSLTLYLVRHGETLFNQRGMMQGWVDSPLTSRGVGQAQRAATQLAGRPLVAIYTSTSERAVDTAEVIAGYHPEVPVILRRGLKEFHFGEHEATPNESFAKTVDVRRFWMGVLAGDLLALPGGENGRDYLSRIDAAFAEITRAHADGGKVVIVSHGVTIAALLVRAGWTSPGPVGNATISIVTVEPGEAPQVVAVGLEDISAYG